MGNPTSLLYELAKYKHLHADNNKIKQKKIKIEQEIFENIPIHLFNWNIFGYWYLE